MSRRLLLPTIVVVVLAAAASLGWWIGAGRWGGVRTDLDERIDLYRRVLLKVRDERAERPSLDARLAALTDRTLGSDLESVDSALRDRLVKIVAASGLGDGVVTTLGTEVAGTPATREFRRSGPERALRDEPDFVLLRASVSATGDIGAVVRFLHGLDASPWVKRVEQVRLDPDRTGERLSVSVRLSTLFVPGVSPAAEAMLDSAARRDLARYEPLVAANPFHLRRPTPPPAVVPTRPARRPEPRVDPAAGWLLTGVIEGDPGTEAWCRQLQSGRTATLLPDQPVELPGGLVATLIGVDGDVAVLRLGDETRRVLVGSTLDRPLP